MPVSMSDLFPEFTQLLIQTQFFRIYEPYVPDNYGTFTQIVPSTKYSEVYPSLGPVPQMTEFRAERKFSGVGNKQTYTVVNKNYDTGIKIPLTVFQDDQYGILAQKIAELAMEGKRLPVSLVYSILHNGGVASGPNCSLGFDQNPLYSTSHPGANGGTQGNTLMSAQNGAAQALNAANLTAAIAGMETLVDQTGRPLGITPDTLVVNPALRIPAGQLLHSTFLMSVGTAASATVPAIYNIPTSNEFGSSIKTLIVNPYLTSSTEWHMLCTSKPTKPVLLQQREAPMLTVKMDPATSDDVLKENVALASIWARWGAAPANWMLAYQGST